MKVNVSELSLKNNQGKYVDFRFKTESMEQPIGFIITFDEAEYALSCLTGTAKFAPWFDDGVHLIRMTQHGFRHLYTGGSRLQQDMAVFPGVELAKALTYILRYSKVDETYTFTPECLAEIAQHYAPVVRWDYREWDDVEPVQNALARLSVDYPYLSEATAHLEAIAGNSSDGLPVTIYLSYDGMPKEGVPPSFYFDIRTPNDERIMNGGIIAHPQYQYPDDANVPELRAAWRDQLADEGTSPEAIECWTDEDYKVRQHFATVVGYEYSTHT